MKIILPKPKILLAFLFFAVFLFGNTVSGQTTGDYRSNPTVASGGYYDWTTVSNWEYYNGTTWITSTTYPGQNSGTYSVLIQTGHTITIGTSGITTQPMGTVTISGSLFLNANNININYNLNTNKLIVTPNLTPRATINFGKKAHLVLPSGAELQVSTDGLSGECSNNNDISVGSTVISACPGHGFDTIMANGGYNTAGTLSGNQYMCTYGTTTTTFTSTASGGNWTSGSPTIATVNSSGVVTAVAGGSSIISYTLSGVTSTRAVYVASGPGGGVSAISGSSSQCTSSTASYTITSNSANYNHTWSYSGTGVTFVASADGRSATATFASNATSGQIVVNSTNACGSGYGNAINVTVDPVPSAPGTAAPNSPSCTGFTAQWAYTSYATKYFLDVSTSNTFSTFVGIYNNLDVGNVTNYALTGLNPGTTYYYRVRAYSNCGTSTSSTPMNYATTASPTTPPVATVATGIGCNQATLNWNSITNATAYYLDIATNSSFTSFVTNYNNLYIGYYPSSGYYAGNLPDGVLYYRVRATNTCNVITGDSNTISFQTTSPIGGSVSPAQTICSGSSATSNLTLTGYTTTSTAITNWQSASDAGFTTNVSYISENTSTLTIAKIGVLTTNTYFRAVVQNQFGWYCTTYSSPVLITVNNSVSTGSSSPTPCINTVMTPITHTVIGFTGIGTVTNLPTGVTPSLSGNTLTISGTPTASGPFNYSIQLTGGSCGGSPVATGTITVNSGLSTVAVTPNSSQTMCSTGSGSLLTAAETGGGVITGRQWGKRSVSGGAITAIGGQTGSTYTPTAAGLTAGTWFVVCTSTPTCGSPVVSNEVTVIVRPAVTATISGTASACLGGSSPNITFTNPLSDAITVTYNINGVGATTINVGASTTATIAAPTGTAGTFVYNLVSAVYQAAPTCSASLTGSVTITVNNKPTITAVSTPAALCSGGSLNPSAPTVTDNGSTVSLQGWQISTTSGGSTYGTLTLPYTVTFADNGKNIRYFATNSCGTTNGTAVAITVSPAPTLSTATQPIFACDNSKATIRLTGLLPNVTSTVSYIIAGDAAPQTATVTADGSGIGYFDTRVLTVSPNDNNKILKITGIASGSTPSCTGSFNMDVPLKVQSNSGSIKLEGNAILGSTTFSELSTAHFSIDPIAGATGYSWTFPPTWNVTAGAGTNAITVTTGAYNDLDITVLVTASNSFCPTAVTVALSAIPPPAPVPSAIVAVSCNLLGSVTFNNLPAESWTLTTIKGSVSTVSTGSGNTSTVSNLTAGDYTFRITTARGSAVSGLVTVPDMPITTWTGGTTWSNGLPNDPAKKIILDAIGTPSGFMEGCSCTVKATANITIGSGQVLKLQNELNVETGGTLTFLNGASLVQKNDVTNSGIIHYNRTTSAVQDFDYVYWSSPVAGQTLGALSPSSDKYWSWDVDNWVKAEAGDVMAKGQGYIARVPRYISAQNVEFVGVPFNGPVTVPSKGDTKGNLVGNPYPCAVDAVKFLDTNGNFMSTETLYFWTHVGNRTLNGAGTQYVYSSNDYASFNRTGGLKAVNGGEKPNGTIAAGQSVFVIGKGTGDLVFTNSMRLDAFNAVIDNSQFFKQANTKKAQKIERNRVWLNLTNEGGAFKQLLVGYITGASNGFDKSFDGPTFNGNTFVDFYSINDSKNYAIQGRGLPFDPADIVPLGYKSTIAGVFDISIENADGNLTNQAIYLEDKVAKIIHNLKSGKYSFTTAMGTFNDRFVLRYSDMALGTDDFNANGKGVVVSTKEHQVKINSFVQNIAAVKVYDIKGSLIYEKNKVDKKEWIINNLISNDQVLIIITQLEDGKRVSDKIIFRD